MGTLLVNVTGSLLLGVLVGAGTDGGSLALLGTGFCGGFTTFSAFAVQAERLGTARGSTYVVATLGLSLGACALGFAAGVGAAS